MDAFFKIMLMYSFLQVKKRQQRVVMILESKNIPFNTVDITEPGAQAEKDFMQQKATKKGETVSDTDPRNPLPPQIFNGPEYCGDYNSFEIANETDALEEFLLLPVPETNGKATNGKSAPEPEPETAAVETVAEATTEAANNGDVEPEVTPEQVETSSAEAETVEGDAVAAE